MRPVICIAVADGYSLVPPVVKKNTEVKTRASILFIQTTHVQSQNTEHKRKTSLSHVWQMAWKAVTWKLHENIFRSYLDHESVAMSIIQRLAVESRAHRQGTLERLQHMPGTQNGVWFYFIMQGARRDLYTFKVTLVAHAATTHHPTQLAMGTPSLFDH